MRDHVRKLLARSSWIAGAVLLAVLILYVGWDDVVSSIASITPGAVLAWIAITLAIRGILVLPLTLPISAMGHTFPWEQAFWLTWARTFCNQIVPLSGVAYFATFMKKIGLSWGELTALGSPQLLIAAAASGGVGLAAVILNADVLDGTGGFALGAVFATMTIAALGLAIGAAKWISLLPTDLRARLASSSDALARLGRKRKLIFGLFGVHATAVSLRALRLFVLLYALGVEIDFATTLLLSSVGEIALLTNLTPGGIGLREGTLLGAAIVLGVDAEATAGAAVVDRILITAITSVFAPWAFWRLEARSSMRHAAPSSDAGKA